MPRLAQGPCGAGAGGGCFGTINKLDRNLFERYCDVQAHAQSAPAESMQPARVMNWIDTMMGICTLMVVTDTNR